MRQAFARLTASDLLTADEDVEDVSLYIDKLLTIDSWLHHSDFMSLYLTCINIHSSKLKNSNFQSFSFRGS